MSGLTSRRALIAAGLGLMATGALSACASTSRVLSEASGLTLQHFDDETPGASVAVAVVGDSLSVGVVEQVTGVEASGRWAAAYQTGIVRLIGGWSKVGADTATMARSAAPVTGADALLIMAGTNDLPSNVSFDDSADNLEAIVSAVGLDKVIVAQIPPLIRHLDDVVEYNRQLVALAADRGWGSCDPWQRMREADGSWNTEYYGDGTHPNSAGYALAATELYDALVAQLWGS